jgi:PAS domain S-box-containing protein
MTKVRGTGESVQMDEDWFVRRDGSMFPVSYTSTPIDMSEGPGVVVAFKDIEEQREAEQALREREAILATVGQPVWVTDSHGRFHYANPAALAALGFSELSELVGKPAHDTVHYKYPDGSPFPEEDCPLVLARKAGETLQDTEDWLVRKDGSIVRVTYSSAPFELPDGLGSVTAFSDVEEQRRAEAAARERDVAQARAEELRVARRRIIEAADAARAQLERDLHDGAQQQFVSAMLQLQLAERRSASDPDGARELRAQAMALASAGVDELRRLAAGIHPAILTDRGLGPAVESLASRLPLPVTVARTPDVRLSGAVEASVYFFVSEGLTNVVKHAAASSATVSIGASNGELTVEVGDDGVGGAQDVGGSGLRGLGDRVAALDGTLDVESPPGGGTRLRAHIPLHG